MDPAELVLAALSVGGEADDLGSSSATVIDAYSALRQQVEQSFVETPWAQVALDRFYASPEVWRQPLMDALVETGAATNPDTVAKAQELMALLDSRGARSGKFHVDIRGTQGVQIGDRNMQVNTFSVPPEVDE